MDTIFAVSSGRPPAAIAVLRVSGPSAIATATTLAGPLPAPRTAGLRTLRHEGLVLDQALVLVFPGPRTASGEDLVELHLHGGRAVVAAVERALSEQPGLRPAEAGEFTRRALANGRIDLIQAQGIADLLEAETEQQRRLAMDSADGVVSRLVAQWMAELSRIGALIEATIDFDDEDDVEAVDTVRLDAETRALADELAGVLARPSVERYRDGIRIVLVGPPNAGKSSLLNALIGREAAIVSPIAGTTRDRVEAQVVRRGRVYTLIDTAGLREETDDPIERIGIERARTALAAADIILDLAGTEDSERAIRVFAQADRRDDAPMGAISTSVFDPETIDHLWGEIERRGDAVLSGGAEATFHVEQRRAIYTAHGALLASLHSDDLLLRAEEVRTATRALAGLLGVDATETMLDALFARFCVGK
ncbi:tRNA uridine-5-carboxymethylaminomethyl(34) synthesis GTPase MnmE [Sphingomonas sp.]|jgi:tRNA modification GTPase|uniref:tRNA uridine-5-carboxymethylaminomethyl(34) synthesis GTPase MnmE n=1 Tax=Sphingomonas sp. TaxID=28214 RepID=UPI00262B6F45|nr:tRNA uridine-5-carboxymethylaminomethyl(34) synthesis GTPase MnmE [Sphingomonas sp.]MDF2605063.1 tRNA uridine-5-carboxymethylaminomethyl(34) synthesis GTPase MnmE [Sphingomonas sp.]